MIPANLKDFMTKLKENTRSEKVHWNKATEVAYFADFKDFNFRIQYLFNPDREQRMYIFEVEKEKEITNFQVTDEEGDWDYMSNLYSEISLSATGFSQELATLFD